MRTSSRNSALIARGPGAVRPRRSSTSWPASRPWVATAWSTLVMPNSCAVGWPSTPTREIWPGHADALLLQGAQRPDRELVGVGEDGGGRGLERQEPAASRAFRTRRRRARRRRSPASTSQPGLGHRGLESLGALGVGGPVGALAVAGADHRDPTVAEVDEVLHRGPADGMVVDLDMRVVADPAAGHDHLGTHDVQPFRLVLEHRQGDQHHRVDLAPGGQLGEEAVALDLAVDLVDQHVEVRRAQLVARARRPSRRRTTRADAAPPARPARSTRARAGRPRGRRRTTARPRSA